MSYEYKINQAVAGLDANEVGNELERIRSSHGELTTKAVVDESRPEDAVFHENFEWDDPVAAELYREHQARKIIHSVVLVPEGDPTAPRPQAFISTVEISREDSEKTRHVYQPAQVVADTPELRARHIAMLKSKLRNQRRELQAFTEFSTVVAAIDGLPD